MFQGRFVTFQGLFKIKKKKKTEQLKGGGTKMRKKTYFYFKRHTYTQGINLIKLVKLLEKNSTMSVIWDRLSLLYELQSRNVIIRKWEISDSELKWATDILRILCLNLFFWNRA